MFSKFEEKCFRFLDPYIYCNDYRRSKKEYWFNMTLKCSKYLFTSTKKTTKKVRNLLKQTKNAYRKLSHIGFLKILETQRFRVKKVVKVEHTKFHALLND